jgi:hypothetical protein
LKAWNTPTNWSVEYVFDITADTVETRGSARVAADLRGSGSVRSLTGEPLPQGRYHLTASDGEVFLTVKKPWWYLDDSIGSVTTVGSPGRAARLKATLPFPGRTTMYRFARDEGIDLDRRFQIRSR